MEPAPPPHLLVVDDDERLRSLLQRFLAREGFRVTLAASAGEAAEKLAATPVDLAVFDIMMPGEDGLSLTARLRAQPQTKDLPILLLTARGENEDRITGLEHGADDYLVKPFEPRELLLRIQAILRRLRGSEKNRLRFGRWHYDKERTALIDDKDSIRLTEAEAALLAALAQSPHESVSREDLALRCGMQVSDRTIDVQITRLRRKVEPDPRNPRYILTMRGEGYRLVPES